MAREYDAKKIREEVLQRWNVLDQERRLYMPEWEDLAKILMPNAGRFYSKRSEKKIRGRYKDILDSTPLRARDILAAGMQAGMASPTRKWFTLQAMNPVYMQSQRAKIWFDTVTDNMYSFFGRSNIYQALHSIYMEMAVFGVGAAIIVPDFYTVSRAHQMTIGEYAIGHDNNGDVNTLYREFEMTAGQLVQEFGIDNVSRHVKNLYEKNNQDEWITVLHAIEPRKIRDVRKRDNRNMPYRSVYIEKETDSNGILRESGFPVFPVICGRWNVTSTDVYGDSPGMMAIGDIRHLFFNQKRKAQGLDQQYNPSLQVPFGTQAINTLPGGITFTNAATTQAGVRRMYEVNTDISGLLEDINDIRNRINSIFYVDMFLMISNSVDDDKTATEVAMLKEEKLMMIGPTYERMQHELYRKLIEVQFYYMNEAGLIPPPPEELRGMPMRVEFTSIMTQAMKQSEVNSIDRFLTSIANVSQFKPEVLDKIDADRFIEAYADMLGVTPEILADDEAVKAIREQRAQQQAAMQQQAMAAQQAQTAKDLASADMSGNNALSQLSSFMGY